MSNQPGLTATAVRLVASTVAYASLLFATAGTLAWPQAWAYLVVLVVVLGAYAVIVSTLHPDLVTERTRPPADAKSWDKPLAVVVAVIGPLLLLVSAGLEQRARGRVPAFSSVNWMGLVMVAAGGAFTNWAVASNRFFSALVRIQRDRGHRVVDTGPYAWVRHPGYAGSTVATFGAAWVLDSRWALGVAAAVTAVMVVRTNREDRVLQAELDGYADYARRVRQRLLPGIW